MKTLVDLLIQRLNTFDVDGALALFEPGAIIDDVSVGDTFVGTDGIGVYLKQFFVGYQTTSELVTLTQLDDATAIVRLDFTGDFGHETGSLRIRQSTAGLVDHIDASLE